MINIENEQRTGKGINIALIDSYIVSEEKFSKYNKTNANLVNTHAQLCLKAAQILAPNANYFLLNASDKFGVITEEAVILALEQCLKLKPSIHYYVNCI